MPRCLASLALVIGMVAKCCAAGASEHVALGLQIRDLKLPAWEDAWFRARAEGDCSALEAALAEGRAARMPESVVLGAIADRDGLCRPVDAQSAQSSFKQAIAVGNVGAMFGLAAMYLDGTAVAESREEAHRLFQKAFLDWGPLPPWKRQAEFVRAALHLPHPGVIPDKVMGDFLRIHSLAAQGAGMADTADKIERGEDGFFADPRAACHWRLSAAAISNPARRALAQQLLEGRGVAKNVPLAAKWLDKAARDGDPEAQAQLGGLLVEGGETLRADPRTATIWLLRARDAGQETGQLLKAATGRLSGNMVADLQRNYREATPTLPRYDRANAGKECY